MPVLAIFTDFLIVIRLLGLRHRNRIVDFWTIMVDNLEILFRRPAPREGHEAARQIDLGPGGDLRRHKSAHAQSPISGDIDMRLLFLVISVLIVSGTAGAQEREFRLNIPFRSTLIVTRPNTEDARPIFKKFSDLDSRSGMVPDGRFVPSDLQPPIFDPNSSIAEPGNFGGDAVQVPSGVQNGHKETFHWKQALTQSLIFLGIQQSYRLLEEKTHRELKGKWFPDWGTSVSHLKGWDDGGRFFTNYISHPMYGSITGRIFVNNSDKAKNAKFGPSKDYWISRLKAVAWTAVWSTQFEIGPVSEASIGNVGKDLFPDGSSKMTWGDIVITPTVGTGILIAEDIVDKYILERWLEKKIHNGHVIGALRIFLTPTWGFANLMRGAWPWKRFDR